MKNFRDLKIFNLNATASAQFSEKELINYLNDCQQKVTILDLRAEYHGFVDGEPISFKHLGVVDHLTKNIFFDLKNETKIITENFKKSPSKFSNVINFLSNNEHQPEILNEENLVKKYYCNYHRIPLQDHCFPNQTQFDQMLNLIKKIDQDQNQKIHVHCAAGKGRTGIFLVIYDIYKNYNNSSLEEIFDRQAKLGSANLNNLKYENEWSDQEKQNIILLKNFYYQLKHN